MDDSTDIPEGRQAVYEGQTQVPKRLPRPQPMLLCTTLCSWPYTSQMLCPSETSPAAQSPRPPRKLAAEDVLTGAGGSTWCVLRQYLVQGWHGSVLEETLEKVPSAQGSQGDDIRSMALAGEEQRWQQGQQDGAGGGEGLGGQGAAESRCAARPVARHSSPKALPGAPRWGSPHSLTSVLTGHQSC